jgi:hypothetical protein
MQQGTHRLTAHQESKQLCYTGGVIALLFSLLLLRLLGIMTTAKQAGQVLLAVSSALHTRVPRAAAGTANATCWSCFSATSRPSRSLLSAAAAHKHLHVSLLATMWAPGVTETTV